MVKTSSVLFVCTHNSARSQMAEALLRARGDGAYTVASAGTHPRDVHPLAVEAMREVDIDLSRQFSRSIDDVVTDRLFDVVVTVCDAAREQCPFVPARDRNLHHGFRDPSAASGTHAERLQVFRDVREEIAAWLSETFPGSPNGSE